MKSKESADLAEAMAEYLRQGGLVSKLDDAGRLVELASEPVPAASSSAAARTGPAPQLKDSDFYEAGPRNPILDGAYAAQVGRATNAPPCAVTTELRAIRAEAERLLRRLDRHHTREEAQ